MLLIGGTKQSQDPIALSGCRAPWQQALISLFPNDVWVSHQGQWVHGAGLLLPPDGVIPQEIQSIHHPAQLHAMHLHRAQLKSEGVREALSMQMSTTGSCGCVDACAWGNGMGNVLILSSVLFTSYPYCQHWVFGTPQ